MLVRASPITFVNELNLSKSMKKLLLPLLSLLILASNVDGRFWTNKEGNSFEGDFVEVDNNAVTIRRSTDSIKFTMNISDLSEADQAYLERQGVKFYVKSENLTIINNLHDKESQHYDIVGIYAVLAAPKGEFALRGNSDINWGTNLVRKPVIFGEYASLKRYDDSGTSYDVRVDFAGKTKEEMPMQYFHRRARLFRNGKIVHLWIVSLKDGSAPWAVAEDTLKDKILEKTQSLESKQHK